ncbi:MAG TPA: HAD family phosphatase [Candidatus Nanoarchaeia archaeon]|nr:HAD family phosphatase [Candidatus Nanoarchaeia archaeon]
MARGIIFDHDDLLAETEPHHCSSTIEMLAHHGIPLTEKYYYEFWVKNGGDLADFVKQQGATVDITQLRRERRTLYHELLRKHLVPFNQSDIVVQTLHAHYPLAVASGSFSADVRLSLQLMGIEHYFRTIITKDDVTKSKPDPEALHLAAQRLHLAPTQLVVIDDAQKGIQAAHAAGMKSIAIPTTRTQYHDFSLATIILGTIQDVTPELISSI